MDHEPDTVRVRSPFERPREHAILVAAMVGFILIALIKPWSFGDGGADGGQTRTRSPIASSTGLVINAKSSPTGVASIVDPNAMACLAGETEQLVIMERWAGHEVRSWVVIADVTVSGPLDGRLVPITVFSNHVVGLGICARGDKISAPQPAARILDVQSIVLGAGRPIAVDLGKPDPITKQLSVPGTAILYGPTVTTQPGASLGASLLRASAVPTARARSPEAPISGRGLPQTNDNRATWATGSYAIAFVFPSDGRNAVRWLRLNLVQGAGEPG